MNASAPRANDWHMASDWVISSRLRLLERSATTPAQADSSRTGPN